MKFARVSEFCFFCVSCSGSFDLSLTQQLHKNAFPGLWKIWNWMQKLLLVVREAARVRCHSCSRHAALNTTAPARVFCLHALRCPSAGPVNPFGPAQSGCNEHVSRFLNKRHCDETSTPAVLKTRKKSVFAFGSHPRRLSTWPCEADWTGDYSTPRGTEGQSAGQPGQTDTRRSIHPAP